MEKGRAIGHLDTEGRRPVGGPDTLGSCVPHPPLLHSELRPLTRPFQHLPH